VCKPEDIDVSRRERVQSNMDMFPHSRNLMGIGICCLLTYYLSLKCEYEAYFDYYRLRTLQVLVRRFCSIISPITSRYHEELRRNHFCLVIPCESYEKSLQP
jgi:hypothetical protein